MGWHSREEKQIPCGDDSKKSKSNGNGERNGREGKT
jgi:hypothetical protein